MKIVCLMTKTIMIVAIATAFIAGSALTSIMSDFQAEAKEKATLDDVLNSLSVIDDGVTDIKSTLDFVDGTVNDIKTTTDDTNNDVGIIDGNVDDIKSAQVVAKSILCGIATSPDGCFGP